MSINYIPEDSSLYDIALSSLSGKHFRCSILTSKLSSFIKIICFPAARVSENSHPCSAVLLPRLWMMASLKEVNSSSSSRRDLPGWPACPSLWHPLCPHWSVCPCHGVSMVWRSQQADVSMASQPAGARVLLMPGWCRAWPWPGLLHRAVVTTWCSN